MDKEIIKLQNTKAAIKLALVDKGLNVSDEFASYADAITTLKSDGDYIEIKGHPYLNLALEYANDIKNNPRGAAGFYNDKNLVIFPYLDNFIIHRSKGGGYEAGMFSNCENLVYFPEGMTIYGEELNGAFSSTTRLYKVDLSKMNTSSTDYSYMFYLSGVEQIITNDDFGKTATTFQSAFRDCSNLKEITINITNACTNLNQAFTSCGSLESLTINGDASGLLNTSSMMSYTNNLLYLSLPDRFPITSYNTLSGSNIKKINGSLIILNNLGYTLQSSNYTVRYILFKDIGNSDIYSKIDFSYIANWGINSDEVPDAKLSLIDSLITYSYDRSANGLEPLPLKLYVNTKNALTQDEIAQITAKGFTIS